MVSTRLWAWSLCFSLAAAFSDTSPFFAFSNTASPSAFKDLPPSLKVLDGATLTRLLSGLAGPCDADAYLLVSQPGVSTSDYSTAKTTPHLARYLGQAKGDEHITQRSSIAQVHGAIDTAALSRHLEEQCGGRARTLDVAAGQVSSGDTATPQILTIEFAPLSSVSSVQRASELADHDAYLNAVIHELGGETTYTVLYTTTPRAAPAHTHEHPDYDMDAQVGYVPYAAEGLHVQMKRDTAARRRQDYDDEGGDDNDSGDRGLFETYNYFNDALFMGGLTFILLASILSVGVSAIASIDVSYNSFTKEMVTQAKKQQGQS